MNRLTRRLDTNYNIHQIDQDFYSWIDLLCIVRDIYHNRWVFSLQIFSVFDKNNYWNVNDFIFINSPVVAKKNSNESYQILRKSEAVLTTCFQFFISNHMCDSKYYHISLKKILLLGALSFVYPQKNIMFILQRTLLSNKALLFPCKYHTFMDIIFFLPTAGNTEDKKKTNIFTMHIKYRKFASESILFFRTKIAWN